MTAEPVGMEPCPFCGTKPVLMTGATFKVFCRPCGLGTPDTLRIEEARAAWNRRTPSAHERALREALEEALDCLENPGDWYTGGDGRPHALKERITALLSTKTERT